MQWGQVICLIGGRLTYSYFLSGAEERLAG